jgi:hypothetical protein
VKVTQANVAVYADLADFKSAGLSPQPAKHSDIRNAEAYRRASTSSSSPDVLKINRQGSRKEPLSDNPKDDDSDVSDARSVPNSLGQESQSGTGILQDVLPSLQMEQRALRDTANKAKRLHQRTKRSSKPAVLQQWQTMSQAFRQAAGDSPVARDWHVSQVTEENIWEANISKRQKAELLRIVARRLELAASIFDIESS